MNVISLCQRNPNWSQIKMLPSNLTIGRYGCTSTALCDLAAFYGCPCNPDQAINQNIFYTPEGLILWNKINFPNFHFVERFYGYDKPTIEQALADPFATVLLEVSHSHWVWALGKSLFGGFRIADPWYGDKATTARYHNDITGGAVFRQNGK